MAISTALPALSFEVHTMAVSALTKFPYPAEQDGAGLPSPETASTPRLALNLAKLGQGFAGSGSPRVAQVTDAGADANENHEGAERLHG